MNPDKLYRDALYNARKSIYEIEKEINQHVQEQKDDTDNYVYSGEMLRLSNHLDEVLWNWKANKHE